MDAHNQKSQTVADIVKSERDATAFNKGFGSRVRAFRSNAGMTLEQLATASNVSRAMLSNVERGEKSPTLSVLSGIAAGLGVTLSQLMGENAKTLPATVIKRSQRLIFRDKKTGIERHLLSPTHLSSGVELIEHLLPPDQEFLSLPVSDGVIEKWLIVRQGQLRVEIGDLIYFLDAEDSMHFQAKGTYRFFNGSTSDCRYYIFILHKDPQR